MDRPSLSPLFIAPPAPAAMPRRVRYYRNLLAVTRHRLAGAMRSILLVEMHPFGRPRQPSDTGPSLRSAMRIVLYRLLYFPAALALAVALLVYWGTHPWLPTDEPDPHIAAVNCQAVNLISADGVAIDGWLLSVLDARRVLAQGELALRQKNPAVLLVHDYGDTWQQMLPYMGPLHQRGFVVMAITLRGGRTHASTFGLREADDVRAALAYLAGQPFVNAKAIGCIAIGTGASACLLAGEQDAPLAAMVLVRVPHSFDDVAAPCLAGMPPPSRRWMQPLCKWSFDVAFGVDGDDVNIEHFAHLMDTQPTLMLDAVNVNQTMLFLQAHLQSSPRGAVAAAR